MIHDTTQNQDEGRWRPLKLNSIHDATQAKQEETRQPLKLTALTTYAELNRQETERRKESRNRGTGTRFLKL